jgi:hypothetical protein
MKYNIPKCPGKSWPECMIISFMITLMYLWILFGKIGVLDHLLPISAEHTIFIDTSKINPP